MGIFDCLKKWFGDQKEKAVVVQISEETRQKYERILSFNKSFRTLLKQDCYIARSDYKHLIAEFEDLLTFTTHSFLLVCCKIISMKMC